jgi:hypothetical protein
MAQKCDVCGKELHVGILSGNLGGRCRICGRLCCKDHYKDRLCPYCREKLGKK